MDSLARFRERNKQRLEARDKLNTDFIFKGYPSVNIVGPNDVTVRAAVVNQQEKDKAYIFTPIDSRLAVGSVWSAKGLSWLITENIVVLKDVCWNKYTSLLCNFEVEGTKGYFRGPEKKYINVSLEEDVSLTSQQKPILVLPEKVLGFEDKIVIKDKAWLVQEYDNISTPGIIYYSLIPSTVSKEVAEKNRDKVVYIEHKRPVEQIIIENPLETFNEGEILISSNIDITVLTENAFFWTSNSNILIKKKTEKEIIFSIPFGIDEVEIKTKEKGDIIIKKYRVV